MANGTNPQSTEASAPPVWHQLSGAACVEKLNVDPGQGLSAAEAARCLQQYGPNRLPETKKEPGWQAFLRQYQDFMQIVLLAAAVISFLIGDSSSATVLVLLTIFNAILGLRQEAKAEESLAALR